MKGTYKSVSEFLKVMISLDEFLVNKLQCGCSLILLDSTSASVGLVIGITLSLLVIFLGIAAGIWYYRSRQQGPHSIMYYKDMSTAPLEEDFDGDDDEKSKINVEYQGV